MQSVLFSVYRRLYFLTLYTLRLNDHFSIKNSYSENHEFYIIARERYSLSIYAVSCYSISNKVKKKK